MKKNRRTISLAASDVEKMIKDLNLLVVSMDRIGSTDFSNASQGDTEMGRYFQEIKAFRILAGARRILSEAYDSQSSKKEVAKLDNAAETFPFWKLRAPGKDEVLPQ